MDNFQRFLTEKNLNEEEVFVLLVGQENDILPGAEYYNYYVIVKTNEMVCYDNNDFNKENVKVLRLVPKNNSRRK